MNKTIVCAMYKFVRLEDFEQIQPRLLKILTDNGIKGTLLLASEGINGTVAGSRENIDTLLSWLEKDPRLAKIACKESTVDNNPFYRSKVKLKKEIVTMGVEGIDPNHIVGSYIKPADWNALISDPDVIVVDTRNDYEIGIGTFEGALNPNTKTFREFPNYAKENLNPEKNKKIAMFCTGGIRCEKSTAYLKEQGFDEVYHLEGGILKYLEEVPKEESLWQGECFVFDNRVAVNHDLEKGQYDQCNACRRPITKEDKARPEYEPGVSCHFCADEYSETQKSRFKEREKQNQLALARGEKHIGDEAITQAKIRKAAKLKSKQAMRQADSKA